MDMYPFRKYNHKKLAAISAAAVLCMASVGVFAATEHWNDASLTPTVMTKTAVSNDTDWQQWKDNWDQMKTHYEQVAIAPGADASQMNFGWYSKTKVKAAEVRIADNKEMKHAKTFKGTNQEGTVISGVTYYSNKVTVKNLKPETTYWYQAKVNGTWQDAQQIKTGNPDDFTFMYVGDP